MKVFAHYFGKPALIDPTFRSWELAAKFRSSGIEFTGIESAEEIWVFDFSISGLAIALRWPRCKRRLFVFEPRAVNPLQHTEFIRQFFGVCYVFSSAQAGKHGEFIEGGGFNPKRQIVASPLIAKNIDSKSKVAISVAAGDKQSLQAGSLYWLRRDAMSALVEKGLEVRLAGPFWEEGLVFRLKQLAHSFLLAVISGSIPRIHLTRPSKFVSARRRNNFKYVGFVEDEIEFYRRGDIVLIIENDLESLSEKLFSAICSGRKVIYAGANEARGLPNLGAVFFAEPTVDSITSVVEHLIRQDKTVSQMDFQTLQHRSFDSFYNRLVSRVVHGH